MTPVYIALGSNLGNPEVQLRKAVAALEALPDTQLDQLSDIYRSVAVGPKMQPDYLNAVIRLATKLSPTKLLNALQKIEQDQGRIREERWGPRTLDLDILLYGDQQVASLISGESHCVVADKTVDATYMNVTVPAMASPSYEVAQCAQCVALNALTRISDQWQHYVVVGAGKTGMDACLFLLEHGVNPDHISWIKPRESWLLDRAQIQSGDLFETSFRPQTLAQFRAVAESDCIEDVFARSCAKGILLRVDENIKPTMYRCATVTQSEVEQLRRIKNVIRLGRVQRIEPGRVVLDEGSFSTVPGTLHVDCTATACI